ncbi:MAG: efflux RND transporter periplasmic adaptor subunit [Candidatus Competibacteraceae bacterium]
MQRVSLCCASPSSADPVRAYLNEADLTRVRLGQTAEVRVDGLPGKVLTGRLAFISPDAEFTPKTVETRALRVDSVYRVKAEVDNPDGVLKTGPTGGCPAQSRYSMTATALEIADLHFAYGQQVRWPG